MRHTEFWSRLDDALGEVYAPVWAAECVMSALGSRTAREALEAGIPPREVWAATWAALDLPATLR